MLNNVRIVLVGCQHPGNIGAAARAMKVMGLSRLYLVAPEQFPDSAATARAAGADDVLDQAVVVSELSAALEGCHCIYGTSARLRRLENCLVSPRECAEALVADPDKQYAIVFGRERSGLTNDELSLCERHIHISTSDDFSSLNLAAAVQVVCYELRMASLHEDALACDEARDVATKEELEGFLQHMYATMRTTQFMHPTQPGMLTRRLRRIFYRSELDKTEVNILRGFLASVDKTLARYRK